MTRWTDEDGDSLALSKGPDGKMRVRVESCGSFMLVDIMQCDRAAVAAAMLDGLPAVEPSAPTLTLEQRRHIFQDNACGKTLDRSDLQRLWDGLVCAGVIR